MRYFILAGLIAGALLGYYVLWSHLVDQVAVQADTWIDSQKKLGRDTGYESRRLWGFPYRLSMTLTKPRWHDPQSSVGWKLEADEVTAHLQLWDLHHVIFELGPNQKIGWRVDNTDQILAINTSNGRASLVLDGAGNWLRVAADLSKPRLSGSLLPSGDLSADKLLLHARRTGNVPPATDLALQADNLQLPPNADSPLGRQIGLLKLVGNARGAAYGKTPEELLGSWRDNGGVIDLQNINVQWGALKLDGGGTVTLDKQFRPIGAMNGELRGADAALDALATAGKMRPQDAAFAKAAVLGLAKRDDKGQPFLPAQLSAQEGKLYLGPVALLNLSSILPQAQQ